MKTILSILILSLFFGNKPTIEFVETLQLVYDPPKKEYVIVIDYTKDINQNRLYLFDMKKKVILIETKVSHAYNSGISIPTSFSNGLNSKKSCGGAFLTGDSYYGKWGYSMKLKGLHKGENDNAEKRQIVFHSTIVKNISYSEGCFETTEEENEMIINLTKNGCLVYVITP